MKKLFWIIIFVLVTIIFWLLIDNPSWVVVPELSAQSATCPAGTVYVGMNPNGPDCQAQPTGCPYGDAIPLDSPKCAPPTSTKPKTASKPKPVVKAAPKATPVRTVSTCGK